MTGGQNRRLTKPPLLIVNGAAGAGKSSLASTLSESLGLPLIDKDTIKEALGDALGAATPRDSDRLGHASYAVMFAVGQVQVELGVGAVLEAPFYSDAVDALRRLVHRSCAALIQCDTDRATLYRRVLARAPSRHWVHFDSPHHEGGLSAWNPPDLAASAPPELGIPILRVVTTDGYEPPLAAIIKWAHDHLWPIPAE
ncbi:MAG: hypothetical protein JWO13_4038 [Acidobacteriales bacterium]|nr:hypothetical protein [Terriglobales bacterium]